MFAESIGPNMNTTMPKYMRILGRTFVATCLLGCPAEPDDGDSGGGGSTAAAATDNGTSNGSSGNGDSAVDSSSSGGGVDRVPIILGLDGDATSGAAVFGGTCALMSCHGPTGDNGIAPSLTERVPPLTPEQIVTTILEGKTGTGMAMPSQAHLTDQAIADVLAYVLATFG